MRTLCAICLGWYAAGGTIRATASSSQSAATLSTDLPEALTSFGATRLGDAIYLFGGHKGKIHAHSIENTTGAFRKLPLTAGAGWIELPGDEPMQGTALVSDGKILYRIGGLIAHNATAADAEDLHSTAETRAFDPGRGSWECFVPLPVALSSDDAAFMNGKIYVVGGWTLNGDATTAVWNERAWELDPGAAHPEWKEIARPPFQRRALAVVAAQDKLHVIGGMNSEGEMTRLHDTYDPAANRWSRGAEFPEEGFGMSACAMGNQIYASASSGQIYRYFHQGDVWQEVGKLEIGRFFHRLLPAGENKLLALGGTTKEGHLKSVEWVNIAPEETVSAPPYGSAPALADPTAKVQIREHPFPGMAKNRQAVFQLEDNLILFGGNNSAEQHDFEPGNFVDETWKINLEDGSANPLKPFPVKRQSMQTLILEKEGPVGLVFGGFGHDGTAALTHSDIWRYDFLSDDWMSLPVSMPKPLTQFGLVERGGEVWVFGGMDFDPKRGTKGQFQIQSDVYRWKWAAEGSAFDLSELKLPRPRRAFGSAMLGDRFYLVGGMRENFEPVAECDVFNFQTMSWAEIASPDRSLISPELVSFKGRIYMACGSTFSETDGFKANTSLMAFEPKANRWEIVVNSVPEIPRHARLFIQDGKLLIVGIVNSSRGNSLRLIGVDPG